ncbi:MAG: UDP-N-acetylmuramoyl-L-alanine--D-glutamate ligase [Pseudomonadales bacterium]|nr:UDP-N-acetylmuramoyl-L-alanine--D-glutamate ligase [Pseudomonadales bacterium]
MTGVAAQTTAILGLGVTGLSCVRRLHGRDRLIVVDTRAHPPGLEALLSAYPDVERHLGEAVVDLSHVDRVIVSPGVGLDSCLLQNLPEHVQLTSDIDLFCEAAQAPILSITGTNGKSTVTALTGHLLAAAGVQVQVGGNLGQPALDLLDPAAQAYALELSSFQLERLQPHRFDAASCLNVTEDHLDRHGSMTAYVASKQRIYRNCGRAVANRSDRNTLPEASVDELVTFGLDAPEADHWGIRTDSGRRWIALGERLVIPCDELPLAGRHNELNVQAALALLEGRWASAEQLIEGLRSFRGLPHRCERVAVVSGVAYINDSKGTNVGATEAALAGFGTEGVRNLILIAGGDGKGADFSPLQVPVGQFVKAAILLGRDADRLAASLADSTQIHRVPDMDQAVELAARLAGAGDLVLLSPACASLDMYRNYEARGQHFTRAVEALAS